MFEFVRHQIDKFNIYVKLLVRGDHYNYDENKLYTGFESLKKYKQNIELQFDSDLDTRMLTIVADRDKLLSIEILDNSTVKLMDSLGLATYPNSEPTILSYHSIFETSWVKSQIRRNQKWSPPS
jgi:hypothetical protein